MFESLTKNLTKIFDKLKNRGTITESDLDETLREVRIALIEADVALPVIKEFIGQIREKTIGQELLKSISAGQMIIKIIHDELVALLKSSDEEMSINLKSTPPAPILMIGLQGSGKTTTTGKLALHLTSQKKRVLLVSLDIYRPAAREQLEIIANQLGISSLPIIPNETVEKILIRAEQFAKTGNFDVIIYDTAGRLNIDQELIDELKYIKTKITPPEILLVIDSLTGQDAVNIAKDFNDAVGITGVVLTRVDGDGRGGAALSVKSITKAPIKFMGVGEKPQDLEVFSPERVASRILDMGDIVSLVEKAMEVSESAEMEKLAKRMQAGKFNLNDYKTQLISIQKIGGISSIMSMLPGMGKLKDQINPSKLSDKPINKHIAIINSMTKLERRNPDLLNASRKKRIASGSGVDISEINKLVKQFMQMSTIMKKMKNMDQKTLARTMQQMM
ncbi:MAG: signal recognition particle protein [Rickettsiaceae bacterium]|nr:signal recognition particle protein [Rickettsiaceae bacterium]